MMRTSISSHIDNVLQEKIEILEDLQFGFFGSFYIKSLNFRECSSLPIRFDQFFEGRSKQGVA